MSQQKPFMYSCQPLTNSSQSTFEENIKNLEKRLIERGYYVPIVRIKVPSWLKICWQENIPNISLLPKFHCVVPKIIHISPTEGIFP